MIIITPPIVNENTEYCQNKYEGATKKSTQLNEIYKNISEKYNCEFIDNSDLETGVDGVHLTEESHKLLAIKVHEKILYITKLENKKNKL